ncbi:MULTISPECIES: alpha/beta fold hydrolase [Nostocales]|nr:alpha/beta hydrolase [Tolypothrix bouteillei]
MKTQSVEMAQAAYLDRCAPGYRTRRVHWSGGTTQVIELGEGTPLLLVHGGMGEAFQWGSILSALAKSHRVLAVDRPGHGLADAFDYRGVDILAHACRFLGDILDTEGLPAVPIVASSMGSLWSVAFALSHPERVPRLVLVGAPAGIQRSQPLLMRLGTLPILKTIVRSQMQKPTRESTRAFWAQLMVAHPERLDDDFLDVSTASQARNVTNWFTLIDSTVDVRGMKQKLVLGDRWKQLSVPTTLIWGEKDVWCQPEVGEAVAASNPQLRVVRIPDAGHAPWFDRPDRVVNAILEALAALR